MQQFSLEHIVGLLVTALTAAVLVAVARRREDRGAAGVARALAIAIVVAYLAQHLAYVSRGTWSIQRNLPLHLTDATAVVAVAALWRPRTPILVELVYFWSLSAALQAILTPGVAEPFPHVLYFTYFIIHGGPVVAACLLVLGCRRIPRPGAAWRVYGLTVAFAGAAAIGTVITGGNYMFLRRKPPLSSLLDVMGPWPWYIAAAAGLALAMFLVLQALADALRRHQI